MKNKFSDPVVDRLISLVLEEDRFLDTSVVEFMSLLT